MMSYTLEEVSRHNGKETGKTWIVVEDLVYDVTPYMEKHPGGPELIEEFAGQDATAGFNDFGHSADAIRMLKDYLIGELVEEDKAANRKKRQKNLNKPNVQGIDLRKRRFILTMLCGKCTA